MGVVIKSGAKKVVSDAIMHPVTVVLKNGASVQCWSPVIFRTGPIFMDKDKLEHPTWTGKSEVSSPPFGNGRVSPPRQATRATPHRHQADA